MSEMKKHSPKDGPMIKTGGPDARKTGAMVLEVLAGELCPTEAAQTLGISLPRYYQIEKQALEGLIAACEPREKGRRQKSAEKDLAEKELVHRRLERELHRAQALLRASQKAIGVMAAVKEKTPSGRKRRTPQVRALKIAKSLVKETVAQEETAVTIQNPASKQGTESIS